MGEDHHGTEWALDIPKSKASAGFFPQEEMEAVPMSEEDPAQGVAAAATTVPAWGTGVARLRTSPQLFDLQLRHQ